LGLVGLLGWAHAPASCLVLSATSPSKLRRQIHTNTHQYTPPACRPPTTAKRRRRLQLRPGRGAGASPMAMGRMRRWTRWRRRMRKVSLQMMMRTPARYCLAALVRAGRQRGRPGIGAGLEGGWRGPCTPAARLDAALLLSQLPLSQQDVQVFASHDEHILLVLQRPACPAETMQGGAHQKIHKRR